MMKPIHDDLDRILDAVAIESAERYILLGESRSVRTVDSSGADPDPGRLVSALAADLYDRLYIRPSPAPVHGGDRFAGRSLVAGLSAANTGRGTWEPGWAIRRVEGTEVAVARDGPDFWIPSAGVRAEGGSIRPGEACRVWVPNELRGLIPGFYLAIGDGEEDDAGPAAGPMLRYYWHLKPAAAIPLVATATTLLNQARVPFRIKVLNDPAAYRRADAGVLYVHGRDLASVAPFVEQIYAAVAHGLRPDVPLFTARLADGLGFAEDVAPSQSFGQHRCRLLAGAMWQSFLRGEVDPRIRGESVADAFVQQGLDPLRPHRGPGWRPEYEPEPMAAARSSPERDGVDARETGTSASPTPSPQWAAVEIGRGLCRSVYWDPDERLCNWVGRSKAEADPAGFIVTPTSAALRPELYLGSAGVALFLAQLHQATGDEEFRRTSLGAMDRSLSQLGRSSSEEVASPLSLFFGDLGVAYAAWRVGSLTGEDELFSRAEGIVAPLDRAIASPHDLDVVGGNAGAIPALLAMSRTPRFERCAELALALGEPLVRLDPRRSGVRSRREDRPAASELEEHTPSGLSHGASGIGLALLELHAATGRPDHREAARRMFEYEDTLFDADRGNWADLRRPSSHSHYELAWCNGAPGIALARLRAAALDPESRESYLAMARVGLATTLDAIERYLDIPRYDATPCHGLAGLIEIVWIAGRTLNEAPYGNRAMSAARALIDRYADTDDWPSGLLSGGPNPSLMLGTAGIGYTFLRLHNPERVPSMLWIGC